MLRFGPRSRCQHPIVVDILNQPQPTAVPHAAARLLPTMLAHVDGRRVALTIDAVGYRVPSGDFAARVHSTFSHACNLESGDTLLTLVLPDAGDGPSSLRLSAGAWPDLRRVFEVGESIRCRARVAHGARVRIDFGQARVWRPTRRPASAPPSRVRAHVRNAAAWLAQRGAYRRSVLVDAAAPAVAALRDACIALDGERAARGAAALIGWGEGLTPAGDDFVVGLCAGLDAALGKDTTRTACRVAIGAAIIASLPRTTRISAHYLRLAAGGHYNQRVLDACDALLSDESQGDVDAALLAACNVGATSGADMLTGLLGALTAWPPSSFE